MFDDVAFHVPTVEFETFYGSTSTDASFHDTYAQFYQYNSNTGLRFWVPSVFWKTTLVSSAIRIALLRA